ncbi:MAG: DUF523 domain-containing protein [Gottschalkiaceae bacterium]|nr:MAG: DUF523 domain-containing protein [Gottschalkiaceae bacterium]
MNILISACLLGINCRYDGKSNKVSALSSIMDKYNLIPVCPEQLGGMTTPRFPSEIIGGKASDVIEGKARVINNQGQDVTYHFIKGAEEALNIAKIFNCKSAILKSKSPSCGYGAIYDGTFNGKLTNGNGICTETLINNGIKVYSEKDIIYFIS